MNPRQVKYLETLELNKHDREYLESGRYNYVEVVSENGITDNVSREQAYAIYDDVAVPDASLSSSLDKMASMLTSRQQEVLACLRMGMKQKDIAVKLNITQSSVSLCINGSSDYKYSKRNNYSKGKRYGGLMRKLKKLIEEE